MAARPSGADALQGATLEQVRAWVSDERKRARPNTDGHGRTQKESAGTTLIRERQCKSVPSEQLVANAAFSLLNLACYLLDRQLAAQAKTFEQEGGFTERLNRVRSARRK